MRTCLTGGIASGKSTVARMLADFGAIIVDADEAARHPVQPGSPGWHQLRDLLGGDFFHADGQLDRRKLRQRIIGDEACRLQVNAILHPAIMASMDAQRQYWREHRPGIPVVLDIPLLFESKLTRHCDMVILVYVPREVQVQRLMARDGVPRDEAQRSLGMQLPIEEKRQWADVVIDNSHTLEDTQRQVSDVWREIMAKHRGGGDAALGNTGKT
ncbi:MAG TPA: dephospho-CoA kinase [Syntrophobacteraceae bacterium]|nr:dephospho-CoA kinase [Syntrophobacteraceae bacterium]